ncbi:hypothetical protein TrVFT333_000176 [Trichoderma virens FT-333]|nr:hypothetical protein TrVFT333_000176 [Trichoderma virens FT-333]
MANLASVGSSFDHRPASVVFIDNRLQEHHQMFADLSVRYDSAVKKYVPCMSTEDDGTASMSRPVLTNINAMKFWEDILPKAMSELNSTAEPKDRSKTTYSIRDKTSWSDIYSSLEAARFKYENKDGAANKLREVRRKAASKIAPLEGVVRIASKVVPEGTCATPVLGSLQVLLDAVKIAARLREKVLESFDDNVSIFSDVELFLGTFPNDENIVNASVDLTVATLKGIELAIGFFISNSHSQETQKLSRNVQTMSERVDKQLQNLGDGFNSMNQLLTEHVKEKDKMLEAARRQLEEAHRENHFLRAENNTLRAYSPFQGGSPHLLPQGQILAPQWYISQHNLRQVLNMFDVDLKDLAYVADKKGQFLPKQRLLAEQIVNTQPFRDWVVSPTSSKLLIHWDSRLPKVIAGVSPLSVFCMTITQALRAKERFLSMLWFCGRHIEAEESGGCVGGRAMITSLIDQLLRQHTFEVHLLSSTTINLSGLQEGNLDTLIELLCYLVRQLPPTVSVFFIIDNAAFFERDEFESEALQIFSILIRLSQDTSIPASIKVLIASTPGTTIIRSAFENEDLILNVEGLPQMVWAANEERVVRELEGGLS